MTLSDVLLHPDEYDGDTVAAPWRPLIGDDLSVLLVSIFGNLFLADAAGRVFLLDSWAGQLHGVSATYQDFKASVGNDAEFFRAWFLVDFVELLESQGMRRSPGQVFAPIVSPGLGGSMTRENFTLAPLRAYVATSAAEVLALRRGRT